MGEGEIKGRLVEWGAWKGEPVLRMKEDETNEHVVVLVPLDSLKHVTVYHLWNYAHITARGEVRKDDNGQIVVRARKGVEVLLEGNNGR